MRGLEIVGVVLLLTHFWGGLVSAQGESPIQDAALTRAVELHQAGDVQGAIRKYLEFLVLHPNRGDVRFRLGSAYASVREYQRAIVQYELASALGSATELSALNFELASAYFNASQLANAEKVLFRIVAEEPENREARLLLAECYLPGNRNKEVIELLSPLISQMDEDSELAFVLGTALIKDDQIERGLELAEMISRRGESAEAKLLLGRAHLKTVDYVRAEEEFKRALELNPNLPTLNATYGELLRLMTRNEEADGTFRKELEINPFDYDSNLFHGLHLSENEQRYEEALACFERALRSRPGDVLARFQIGVVYSLTNRIDEAIELIEAVVEDASGFEEGHATLVRLYYRQGRTEEAEHSRMAAEYLKTQSDGHQLMQQGRLSEAVERFNRLKRTDPLNPAPYFLVGMALVQMKDWKAAVPELEEAVRLDPERPEFLITYANALTHSGQHERAIESLGALQPEWLEQLAFPMLWLLGEIYFGAEQTCEALQVVAALAQKEPDNAQVDLFRGQIFFATGDLNQATEALETSVQKEPGNNPLAYFVLGEVRSQLGQTDGAKEAYLKAVNQDPKNQQYLVRLGATLLALGQTREAIDYLEGSDPSPEISHLLKLAHAVEKDQITLVHEDSQVSELLGQAERILLQGKAADAEILFKQVLEIDPENWSAHTYLVDLYLRAKIPFRAYHHLTVMEKLAPESPTVHFLMAEYWYQSRNYRKALDYALRVETLHTSNAEFRNLLGNIHLGVGDAQQAEEHYAAATQLAPDRPEFKLNLEAARKRLKTDD